MPDDCTDTLGVRKIVTISHHFSDNRIFAFYAEFQYGRRKWRENDFWQQMPDNSSDILGIKNFVEIALSHTVSEMNEFLRFMKNFKMAAKNGRK